MQAKVSRVVFLLFFLASLTKASFGSACTRVQEMHILFFFFDPWEKRKEKKVIKSICLNFCHASRFMAKRNESSLLNKLNFFYPVYSHMSRMTLISIYIQAELVEK